MINRGMFAAIVAGSIGVPYLLTNTKALEKVGIAGEEAKNSGDKKAAKPGDTHSLLAQAQGKDTQNHVNELLVPRPQDIADVFRFTMTTMEIFHRWPRVTTQSANLELKGYRVPLVTGGREDDLAGSLTYYFNAQQKVQRIVFNGSTGDPRRLVSVVTNRFKLTRQPNSDPGLHLYQLKDGEKAVCELRIRTANIIHADQPHSRYEIALWLENGDGA